MSKIETITMRRPKAQSVSASPLPAREIAGTLHDFLHELDRKHDALNLSGVRRRDMFISLIRLQELADHLDPTAYDRSVRRRRDRR